MAAGTGDGAARSQVLWFTRWHLLRALWRGGLTVRAEAAPGSWLHVDWQWGPAEGQGSVPGERGP